MAQAHVDMVTTQMRKVTDAHQANDAAHRATVIELHRDGRAEVVQQGDTAKAQVVQRG